MIDLKLFLREITRYVQEQSWMWKDKRLIADSTAVLIFLWELNVCLKFSAHFAYNRHVLKGIGKNLEPISREGNRSPSTAHAQTGELAQVADACLCQHPLFFSSWGTCYISGSRREMNVSITSTYVVFLEFFSFLKGLKRTPGKLSSHQQELDI